MNNQMSSNINKAQKGWLSRWTRKQWSRHWFVLKNGSLTYYRGPAAELCSFLDGVLDLSLIKHIEVQQGDESSACHQNNLGNQQNNSNNNLSHQNHHLHHQNHHHHIGNNHNNSNNNGNNNNNNNSSNSQFTFSLKMWNGECHLLGASSAAERSLWLEAINACTNGEADDDAATDSASSSDSSPTSNLSAKSADIGRVASSRYPAAAAAQKQQSQEQQLSLDQLALSLKSSIKRREQDVLLELKVNANNKISDNNGSSKQMNGRIGEPLDGIVERRQHQQQDQQKPIEMQTNARRLGNIQDVNKLAPINQQYLVNNLVTCSSQPKLSDRQLQISSQNAANNDNNKSNSKFNNDHNNRNHNHIENQQQDENQAFKRRLMCVQARLNSNDSSSNEPKLITRQAKRAQDLLGNQFHHLRRAPHLHLNASSSDEDDEDDDDDEESSSLSSDSETTTSIVDEDDDDDDANHNEDDDDERVDDNEIGQENKRRQSDDAELTANQSRLDLSPKTIDNDRSGDCVIMMESDHHLTLGAVDSSRTVANNEQQQQQQSTALPESLSGIIKQTAGAQKVTPSSETSSNCEQAKQKKRVTFDLSSALCQHSNGNGSSSDDSSLSSSSSLSGSSSDEDEDEEVDDEEEQDDDANDGREGAKEEVVGSTGGSAEAVIVAAEEQLVDLMSDQNATSVDTRPTSGLTEVSLLDCNINSLIKLQYEANNENTNNKLPDEHNNLATIITTTTTTTLQDATTNGASSDEQQPMDTTSISSDLMDHHQQTNNNATGVVSRLTSVSEQFNELKCRNEELTMQLEKAQANIVSLEMRLGSSYVSYGQLEMSYNQLQGELAKLDESHKSDLDRLQWRVDELTRDLAASERRLEEASDKLLKFEAVSNNLIIREESAMKQTEQSDNAQTDNQTTPNIPANDVEATSQQQIPSGRVQTSAKPLNWLKSTLNQQQVSHSHSNLHHHQPLLLMHHVKHTLAVNQQTLGLKLLNHSKQIQRKLNELELKVDKIQSINIKEASLVNI